MKKTLSYSLITLLISLVLSGCSGKNDQGNRSRPGGRLVPAVEAVQARLGSLPLTERLTGVVRAENQIEVYSQVSARITQVYVQNGDKVNQNQPLIQLRDTEFQEQLKQARASYQIAQAQAKQSDARFKEVSKELERKRTLAEKNMISDSELETIESQVISAEADVELAHARVAQAKATMEEREETLSHTIIRAPVSGSVGNRNAEIGMLVNSGTRLFTMGQLDKVRVQVVLTDRMLGYIEEGMRSEILIETMDGPMSAPLSRISPFLNPVTHSTEAEIDVSNIDGKLASGMFVTVDVYYGESEQATLVPMSALYDNPITGAAGVYVVRGELGNETPITTDSEQSTGLSEPIDLEFVPVNIIARGRMSAGVTGVKPDEWVVTIGQDLLAGKSGKARVQTVNWGWVEGLQQLQRQDLLKEVLQEQQETSNQSTVN